MTFFKQAPSTYLQRSSSSFQPRAQKLKLDISVLPLAIIQYCMEFLDINEIIRLKRVSHGFVELVEDLIEHNFAQNPQRLQQIIQQLEYKMRLALDVCRYLALRKSHDRASEDDNIDQNILDELIKYEEKLIELHPDMCKQRIFILRSIISASIAFPTGALKIANDVWMGNAVFDFLLSGLLFVPFFGCAMMFLIILNMGNLRIALGDTLEQLNGIFNPQDNLPDKFDDQKCLQLFNSFMQYQRTAKSQLNLIDTHAMMYEQLQKYEQKLSKKLKLKQKMIPFVGAQSEHAAKLYTQQKELLTSVTKFLTEAQQHKEPTFELYKESLKTVITEENAITARRPSLSAT